mgnify:CR=1 FL=1
MYMLLFYIGAHQVPCSEIIIGFIPSHVAYDLRNHTNISRPVWYSPELRYLYSYEQPVYNMNKLNVESKFIIIWHILELDKVEAL